MAAYREGRRRKLLREDARAGSDVDTQKRGPARKRSSKRTYSDAARHANQPRITDLIPQRPLSLTLLWLLGLLVPATLAVVLFLSLGNTAGDPSTRPDESFRLAVITSLSRWWSSVVMLVAAAICGVNYHLRRYKLDDYRARYRVWLIATVIMVVASADVATNMHAGVYSRLATKLSEGQFAAVRNWWGPVMTGFGLFAFLRLAIEMWASRGASAVLFLALASYSIGALVLGSYWQLVDPRWRILTLFSAANLGHHQLVFSLLLFCRHVYRSAQGARALESNRKKKRRTARVSNEPGQDSATRRKPSNPDLESDSDDSDSSKSEFRRQRKEMRRHQRRAA